MQQRNVVTRKANVLEHDLKYGRILVDSGVHPTSFSPSCRNLNETTHGKDSPLT